MYHLLVIYFLYFYRDNLKCKRCLIKAALLQCLMRLRVIDIKVRCIWMKMNKVSLLEVKQVALWYALHNAMHFPLIVCLLEPCPLPVWGMTTSIRTPAPPPLPAIVGHVDACLWNALIMDSSVWELTSRHGVWRESVLRHKKITINVKIKSKWLAWSGDDFSKVMN